MSNFWEQEVETAQEPELLEAGREYSLQVIDATPVPEKNQIRLQLQDQENPNSSTLLHILSWPLPDDDTRKANFKALNVKQFLQAAGFDPSSPPMPDEYVGVTVDAIVGIREYQGRKMNQIQNLC